MPAATLTQESHYCVLSSMAALSNTAPAVGPFTHSPQDRGQLSCTHLPIFVAAHAEAHWLHFRCRSAHELACRSSSGRISRSSKRLSEPAQAASFCTGEHFPSRSLRYVTTAQRLLQFARPSPA